MDHDRGKNSSTAKASLSAQLLRSLRARAAPNGTPLETPAEAPLTLPDVNAIIESLLRDATQVAQARALANALRAEAEQHGILVESSGGAPLVSALIVLCMRLLRPKNSRSMREVACELVDATLKYAEACTAHGARGGAPLDPAAPAFTLCSLDRAMLFRLVCDLHDEQQWTAQAVVDDATHSFDTLNGQLSVLRSLSRDGRDVMAMPEIANVLSTWLETAWAAVQMLRALNDARAALGADVTQQLMHFIAAIFKFNFARLPIADVEATFSRFTRLVLAPRVLDPAAAPPLDGDVDEEKEPLTSGFSYYGLEDVGHFGTPFVRPIQSDFVSKRMPLVTFDDIGAFVRLIEVSLCYGLIPPHSLAKLVIMSCRIRGCSLVHANPDAAVSRMHQPHPSLWIALVNLLRSHCSNATLRIIIQVLLDPSAVKHPVIDVESVRQRPSVAIGAILVLQAIVRRVALDEEQGKSESILPSLSLVSVVGAVDGAARRHNNMLDLATVLFLRFGLKSAPTEDDDSRSPFERIFGSRLVDGEDELVTALASLATRHVGVWKTASRPPTDNNVAVALRVAQELAELVQQPQSPAIRAALTPVRVALAPMLPDEMLVDLVTQFRGQHEYIPGAPNWIERLLELVNAFFFREAECIAAPPAVVARTLVMELVFEVYDAVQDMPQFRDAMAKQIIVPIAERVLPHEPAIEVSVMLRHILRHAAASAALDANLALFDRIRAIFSACISETQHTTEVVAEHATAQHSRQTSSGPSNVDAERERSTRTTRAVNAVSDVIDVFQQLAFSLPSTALSVYADDTIENCRTRAASATATLYRDLLHVVQHRAADSSDDGAPVARAARVAALQWLMHLRTDRHHALYFASNVAGETQSRAQLLHRTFAPEQDDERGRGQSRDRERGDRTQSRSRMVEQSLERGTSTRKRPSVPLWSVPESFAFTPPLFGDAPGDVAYVYPDPDMPEGAALLPIHEYLALIVQILQSEPDWEIVSYVLVNLPAQLRNKHMFCGKLCGVQISVLLSVMCHALHAQRLVPNVMLSDDVRRTDVYAVAYSTLVVLISYRKLFSRAQQDELVEVFIAGLSRSQNTAQPCIRALVLSCHELQKSVIRHASGMLVKLSTIMSSTAMSAHILELIVEIGSVPAAYANFTDAEYKRVFGIALQYIQYHQSTAAADREDIRSSPAIFSLSQYVMMLAYFNIAHWFMTLRLNERPKHVPYIARGLMLANEGREQLTDQTAVCLDFLARFSYSAVEPKPARSLIRFLVAGDQPTTPQGQSEAHLSRTWLIGSSLVTITSLQRPRWFEFVVRRPSGTASFIAKLENSPSSILASDESTAATLAVLVERLHTHAPIAEPLAAPLLPGATNDTDKPTPHEGPLDTRETQTTDPAPRQNPPAEHVAPSSETPRRREMPSDPAFVGLQFSAYPKGDVTAAPPLLPVGASTDRLLRSIDFTPVYDFHKIGVVYVGYDQDSEADILANRHGSSAYMRFLSGLGDLVPLRGQQDVYTGGLDRQSDEHGKYAYVWTDSNLQVVYHTSTMMPNRETDPSCASKKALIGNDWVHIVFNESNKPYRFGTIASQFNFCNIVISPHSRSHGRGDEDAADEETFYHVELQRRPGLPDFSPVGEGQLVSLATLPKFVRMLAVNCDLMSQIYLDTGESMVPYTSNWVTRLHYIERCRAQLSTREGAEPADAIDDRDFTRVLGEQ